MKYWCEDFHVDDISGPEDNGRICVDCFKRICKNHGISLRKRRFGEGLGNCLGKGFGQGLFNKDSLLSKLSSKPVEGSVPEEELEDKYVLIEVDGGDEYFIENIEPVRRLEPGEEILFTGPSVKYIKHRLAEMNRWDILDAVRIIMRPVNESVESKVEFLDPEDERWVLQSSISMI